MVTANLASRASPEQKLTTTEVGLIPIDWSVKLLPEVCHFRGGKAHEQYVSQFGEFVCVNSKFISTDGRVVKYTSRSFATARRGDILMVMSDLPNGKALAKAFVADRDDHYAVNQRVCALTPYNASSRYLYYALNRNPYFLKFDDGVSQTHLLNPVFQKCPVALPPTIHEQEAIAEALSDADDLIASLETLIAKKRAIKQGAMQRLLTGEQRLSGFKDVWREWSMLDLAEGRKALFDDGDWIEAEHLASEGVRFIQTGNIGVGEFLERTEKKYVRESSVESLRCKFVEPGDLLICRLADPAGRACVMPNIGEPQMVTSVDVTIFRPPSYLANRNFLQQVFSTDTWLRLVSERSGGTTHKRIARGALGKLTIMLPSVEEQTAIASVLSDMDSELIALSDRLEKARQLKQGMTQDLLSGRVRLI